MQNLEFSVHLHTINQTCCFQQFLYQATAERKALYMTEFCVQTRPPPLHACLLSLFRSPRQVHGFRYSQDTHHLEWSS